MAVTLGSKNVGNKVKIRENGDLVDFIIIHKGIPSQNYDSSCDGVWVIRERLHYEMQWNANGNHEFPDSSVKSWLDNTYYNLFGSETQSAIKRVKIPYYAGGAVYTGGSGIECRCFLLSEKEVGTSNFNYNDYGTLLSYFENENNRAAFTDAGVAGQWFTRSPYSNGSQVYCIANDASYSFPIEANSYRWVRPVMILDYNAFVNDDGSVTANTAPTTPGRITVPGSAQGGSTITISWTASVDAQGNLEGYKVERSIDGGTWTQIYQGGATSTTNNVPYGANKACYRVKAYDSMGLESGYRASSNVTIINNTAPGAPQGITVPESVRGGSTITISWGQSTDAENNLAGYELERSVNGEAWAQIYKNAQQSFTDSITLGWNTVAYRVRAYDAYNAYSSYTASEVRTVNNNRPPQITCDFAAESDLGVKNEGFSIIYTVADPDNSTGDVIVTESLDGMKKKEFSPELEAENIFAVEGMDFQCLLNGQHSITISASDGKESCMHTLTFTKSVTSAMITLKTPVNTEDRIKVCAVEVNGYIPEDAKYRVLVTNNAKDTEPVWEDCTQAVKNGANYLFTNQNAETGYAFNFKISVSRGESGTGGYITAVQGGFQ